MNYGSEDSNLALAVNFFNKRQKKKKEKWRFVFWGVRRMVVEEVARGGERVRWIDAEGSKRNRDQKRMATKQKKLLAERLKDAAKR